MDKLIAKKLNVQMKGMLSVWIVYLLKKKPMNGYQIVQEISQITGDTWQPTTGSVYPALHKMKKNGIISSKKTGARGGIEYSLSQKGEELYSGLRKQVAAIMGNAKFRRVFESLLWPDEPDEFRDEAEAISAALVKKRGEIRKDHAKYLARLRHIRGEIENL